MSRTLVRIISKLTYMFPGLAMRYRHFSDYRNRHKKPTMTKYGFYLTGNKLMEKGDFEIEETELIKKLMKNVDIMINIGANIGYYCCLAGRLKKKIIAFEPLPSNLYFLYKNIRFNKLDNDIEIFPIALSDKSGMLNIFGFGTGASLIKGWAGNSENYSQSVPVNKFDSILSNRFADDKMLVIIDVEGAELSVLKGSIEIMSRMVKPIWFVEITVSEHQPEVVSINPNLLETFKLFWDFGYKSVTANESLSDISKIEIDSVVQTEKDTLNSHNFIFYDKTLDIHKLIN